MSAIILDTETTDAESPEVIELAWLGPLLTPMGDARGTCIRFKPAKAISLGAMATHHIIDADLIDCPPWLGWQVPADVVYLVGHKVDFDWKAIGSPNIRRICTLALSKSIWPSLDSHTLTAMTYHIHPHHIAREIVKNSHNAAHDVQMCHELLRRIHDEVGKPESWEQFWRISEQARIPTVLSFGKHKGRLIKEIRREDPSYINWCLSGKCDLVNDDPYLRQALTQ